MKAAVALDFVSARANLPRLGKALTRGYSGNAVLLQHDPDLVHRPLPAH